MRSWYGGNLQTKWAIPYPGYRQRDTVVDSYAQQGYRIELFNGNLHFIIFVIIRPDPAHPPYRNKSLTLQTDGTEC